MFVEANRIQPREAMKMKGYLTTEEVSIKWNVSIRRVQTLCSSGRINGAEKHCNSWFIPVIAEKPTSKKPGKKVQKDINLVSLFSGCGGMDLGFEGGFRTHKNSIDIRKSKDWVSKKINSNWIEVAPTRFKTIFANDIVPSARVLWTKHFEKKDVDSSVYYLDSIVDLVKIHNENLPDIFPDNVDIVTGGFPCQDFSIAGKREGFNSSTSHNGKKNDKFLPTVESRGQLYMWMREVISITRPKIFVAENVKGMINLENVKEIIESDFASINDGGYIVVPARVLHAANYGVPQNRERVIFYGFKRSALRPEALKALSKKEIPIEYDPYPIPTHSYGDIISSELLPFVRTKDYLLDLGEPQLSTDASHQRYSKAKYMGKHCQGQTEINLEGIAPTIRSEHHGNIEYRRLSQKNGGRISNELKRDLKERRLSVRECARIQTFPDDYEFVISNNKSNDITVSASSAYRLIGNAVPPVLAYNIAKRLEEIWDLVFK